MLPEQAIIGNRDSDSDSRAIEDDKLDVMLNLIRDMNIDQKEIKNEIKQMRTEQGNFKEELLKMQKQIEELRQENEQLKKENKDIKEEIKEIKHEVEQSRKEKKKNNVIMSGLSIENTDPEILKDTMKLMVNEYVGVEVKVKSAAKIGDKTYLMELEDQRDKETIMKNKYKLKNVRNKRIYINDDLTKSERG